MISYDLLSSFKKINSFWAFWQCSELSMSSYWSYARRIFRQAMIGVQFSLYLLQVIFVQKWKKYTEHRKLSARCSRYQTKFAFRDIFQSFSRSTRCAHYIGPDSKFTHRSRTYFREFSIFLAKTFKNILIPVIFCRHSHGFLSDLHEILVNFRNPSRSQTFCEMFWKFE